MSAKHWMTLFTNGHPQNAAYLSLGQLRRMAERRPGAFAELGRVMHCYANGEALKSHQKQKKDRWQ